MKKRIVIVAAALALAALGAIGVSRATTPVYTSNLVNDVGLAYSNTYPLDLNALGVATLAMQAVYSSSTLSTVNFANGVLSTGSFTVAANSGLAVRQATNTITITQAAATKASDFITISSTVGISGVVITVNNTQLIAGRDWTPVSTTTGTAQALATLLDSFPGLDASRGGSVVYATAAVAGLGGNSFTMSSSLPLKLTVNGASFTGGAEAALTNAVLTVNGKAYRNGYEWKSTSTPTGTAAALAAFLNTFGRFTSTNVAGVVYSTVTTPGAIGNTYTLASNDAHMVVGGGNYSNGQDSATVSINGSVVTYGTDWTSGSTASATAKSISDAFMAVPAVAAIVTTTFTASGVVSATSTAAGGNYALAASPSTSLTRSGALMTGGVVTAIDTTNETITSAAHGLTTAYGVVFSTLSASTPPGGLAFGTTYYVIRVDANTIKLATGTAAALANVPVNLTSQGSASGTFRLTPQTISGSASFKWQASNDSSHWSDISVSSVTFGTPYAADSSLWDFGTVNYRYIRLNFVAPSAGGVHLVVTGNGKSN